MYNIPNLGILYIAAYPDSDDEQTRMKVHDQKLLYEFVHKYTDAKSNLESWLAEAREAEWRTPNDIKQRYRTASILSDNRVVFNICGNKYRLLVQVAYRSQVVVVLNVGTHAEYDKWNL